MPPATPPSAPHLAQAPFFTTAAQTPGTDRRSNMVGFITPSRGLADSPTTSLYPFLPSPPRMMTDQQLMTPHTSSQIAHRATKRCSPSYQLPLSSIRPHMYRRVGTNFGLGLHMPSASLPMAAYQISAGSRTPTPSKSQQSQALSQRRLQEGPEDLEPLLLQPPHASSLNLTIQPRKMRLTLPRLDVLDMPHLAPSPVARCMVTSVSGPIATGQPTLDVTSPHRPQSSPAAIRISDIARRENAGPDAENDNDSLLCSSSDADTRFEEVVSPAHEVAGFVSPLPRSGTMIPDRRQPPDIARSFTERATNNVFHSPPPVDERYIRVLSAPNRLSGNLKTTSDGPRTRSRSERGPERSRSSTSASASRSNIAYGSGSGSSSLLTFAQCGRSPTAAREDLIEHAYNLKLFLAFAPEVLFMDEFQESPGSFGDSQHTTRGGSMHSATSAKSSFSGSFSQSRSVDTMNAVEGSIFITRPRASKYGNSGLDTLSSIPIRPVRGTAASSSSSPSDRPRTAPQEGYMNQQARCPTDMEIMLSSFETFYAAHPKARDRLARIRESNVARSATGLEEERAMSSTASLRAAAKVRKVGRPKKATSTPSEGTAASPPSLPHNLPPMPIVHRFPLPVNTLVEENEQPRGREEVFVSCVLWDGQVWLTGTDICRIIRFRFEAFGRRVVNVNKFHEGIYSDLRTVKAGDGAVCEEPKSPFLEALYIYEAIQCSKRQKVFHWLTIAMHDQLFLDQLSRDLERGAKGEAMCTEAVREPARSFCFDPSLSLADQLGLEKTDSHRPALQLHDSHRPRHVYVDRAALYALALGIREN
ncbi:hypothetical protein OC861_005324 [Tilletia horrida]|nr:hypothetical protein OC861_005324 [Tilletia horrida]